MKRIARTALLYLCLPLTTLLIAVGLITLWPLFFFPTTDINIEYQNALRIDRLSHPTTHPAELTTPLAGIAEVDITPPIGIPKFGYSTWAKKAKGFRTRLKARAFYLEPTEGPALAIIQADLGAGSLLLHHKVAEIVSQKSPIGFGNLTINVTHTHNGPGQYFSNDFYNLFGSNKPGFDPELFNFLVEKLTDAVLAAYHDRAPAKIAIGERRVYGLTQNRSLPAYLNNRHHHPSHSNASFNSFNNASHSHASHNHSPQHTYHSLTNSEQALSPDKLAVNPSMIMVRIDQKDRETGQYFPKGAFTTFAIHGTGMPAGEHLYHADVWSRFANDLEHNIRQHYQTPWQPIHGPFEANHGDNNPAYSPELRGHAETARIGQRLAKEAWSLFQSLDHQLNDNITLNLAAKEINLLQPKNLEHQALIEPLCDRALVGTALIAGATGDEIFPLSYLFPFKKGTPNLTPPSATHPHRSSDHQFSDKNCHQAKRRMLSFLQPLGLKPTRFPDKTFFQLIQINELLMFNAPYEITFEAGNRIIRALEGGHTEHTEERTGEYSGKTLRVTEKASSPEIKYTTVSMANGYTGYATTAEEYALQYYEGGHTLYGPGTTQFLVNVAQRMKETLTDTPEEKRANIDLPDSWEFALASYDYFPKQVKAKTTEERPHLNQAQARQLLSPPTFYAHDRASALKEHYAKNSFEGAWSFTYQDQLPAFMELDQPLLSVEYRIKKGGDTIKNNPSTSNNAVATPQPPGPLDQQHHHDRDWKPLVIYHYPMNDQTDQLALLHLHSSKQSATYRVSWYISPASYLHWLEDKHAPQETDDQKHLTTAPFTAHDKEFRIVIEPRAQEPRFTTPPFSY